MKKKVLGSLLISIFLFFLPIGLTNQALLHFCIVSMLYIIISSSLKMIMDTGQVSIGHSAFMAIGAYTSSLLTLKAGFNFYLAFILSGISSGFIAFLIGIPILRIKGFYFAIVTFALCEVVRMIVTSWVSVFGGANGITDIAWPEPLSLGFIRLSFDTKASYYYLVLIVMLSCLIVIWRIGASFYGRIFKSIEESDEYAHSLGINVDTYKMFTFCLSCFFAGLAGSLYAHYMHYISPGAFTFWLSVEFIIMVIVGGRESKYGPIFGSLFFVVAPELLRATEVFQGLFFAVSFLIVLFILPKGLAGLSDLVGKRFVGINPQRG